MSNHRKPTRLRRIISALAAFAVALSALILAGVAANAADSGRGYTRSDGSFLGGYFIGGIPAFCLEIGAAPPVGHAQAGGTVVSSYTVRGFNPATGQLVETRTLTGNDMARLNLLYQTYGSSTSPVDAAALSLATKSIANPGAWASSGYGDAWYRNIVIQAGGGGTAAWNQVVARVATMRAEAAAYSRPVVQAALGFSVTPGDYRGHLVVAHLSLPGAATITLTNGVFTDTGKTTYTGSVSAGMRLPIRGVNPGAAGGGTYKISASMTGATTATYPDANLRIWSTPAGNRQALGAAGTSSPVAFSATAIDPTGASTTFEPTAATRVAAKYVQAGDALVDTVTVGVKSGMWPQFADNTYLQLTFHGTVYRVDRRPDAPTQEVPADAVPVGRATVTTSRTAPLAPYTATADAAAGVPGYYVWVWELAASAQTGQARFFLPAGYAWRDAFGLADETHVAPPTVTTTAPTEGIAGYPLADVAHVEGAAYNGYQLTFAAYLQPAGALQPVCTPETRVWSSEAVPVDGPGDYVSPTFTPPAGGIYHWVHTLWHDGNAVGAGVCGDPAETTTVQQVTIATQATASAMIGDPIHDVATISGVIPDGASLTFNAYAEGSCEAPVASLDVAVEARFYDVEAVTSPELPTAGMQAGAIWWVHELRDATGATIHEGACGDPAEISLLIAPAPQPEPEPEPEPEPQPEPEPELIRTGGGAPNGVLALGLLLLAAAAGITGVRLAVRG